MKDWRATEIGSFDLVAMKQKLPLIEIYTFNSMIIMQKKREKKHAICVQKQNQNQQKKTIENKTHWMREYTPIWYAQKQGI